MQYFISIATSPIVLPETAQSSFWSALHFSGTLLMTNLVNNM